MQSTTKATQDYWMGVVCELMEARLMPPQFDEFKRAMDDKAASAREDGARRMQMSVLNIIDGLPAVSGFDREQLIEFGRDGQIFNAVKRLDPAAVVAEEK